MNFKKGEAIFFLIFFLRMVPGINLSIYLMQYIHSYVAYRKMGGYRPQVLIDYRF